GPGAGPRSEDSPLLRGAGRGWQRAGHTPARSHPGRLTGNSRPAGAGEKPAPIAVDRPLKTHFTKNGCAVRSAYRMLGCLSTNSTAGRYSRRLGPVVWTLDPLRGARPSHRHRGRERLRAGGPDQHLADPDSRSVRFALSFADDGPLPVADGHDPAERDGDRIPDGGAEPGVLTGRGVPAHDRRQSEQPGAAPGGARRAPDRLRPAGVRVRAKHGPALDRVLLWGVGLDHLACPKVTELAGPSRVVLDFPPPP